MKQVLQDLRSGQTVIAEVPAPKCQAGHLRVATTVSVISAGTERMLVDFARGSLLSKARQQPERVRDVLQKAQTDGIVATLDAVFSKLGQPMTLGYCSVGRVTEIGSGVSGFKVGDRVVTNGKHAEVVVVPPTLAANIPANVNDETAAFSVLGAIALQGVRLANPTIGEVIVVTGLGLIGLIAVQILRANGCKVIGIDSDPARLELAKSFGAKIVDLAKGQSPLEVADAFSRGRGVDAVLLTLASKSSDPVSQAAKMCRKRGRIVLVGVTGLELNRTDFYEKELTFQVSCSYGPGRYDANYEAKGQDYPLGFVRWTEQRNFEAVLDLMAAGTIKTDALITHRFAIEDASQGYDVLTSNQASMGILISYPSGHAGNDSARDASIVSLTTEQRLHAKGALGVIGAGNYAGRVLLGAFKEAGADFRTLVSANGVSATHYGRKLNFQNAGSDAQTIFDDRTIDTVCVATRHDSHARYVQQALKAGKHVFVEKPLCLTLEELAAIETVARDSGANAPILMVGFNRRFSPLMRSAMAQLAPLSEPKSIVMTMNAGAIPPEHWTQDATIGGGRIIGEACHFIDLARHIAGAPIQSVSVNAMKREGGAAASDTAIIMLGFENGSIATINYFANGHKSYPKERIEIFCAGRVLLLDNFRSLRAFGFQGFSGVGLWRQNKGQAECAKAFMDAIRSGTPSPIPLSEILEISRASIDAANAAR